MGKAKAGSASIRKIESIADIYSLLKKTESSYSYQKSLTEKLDSYSGDFTVEILLEIILWKLNRYADVGDEIINEINSLRQGYSKEKAIEVLRLLLKIHGIALPLASAILRFACPQYLQIIDQRVYRLIMKDDKLKLKRNKEELIQLYFDYLNCLKAVCEQYNIEFQKADRILYLLDKLPEINGAIKIH